MTRDQLLADLARLRACAEATQYVTDHASDDAREIGLTCTRTDWLIWYLGRRDPHAIAGFARRCADRAAAAAADVAAYAADVAAYAYAAAAYWTRAAAAAAYATYVADDAAAYRDAVDAYDVARVALARVALARASDRSARSAADADADAAQLRDLHEMWGAL